MTITPERPCDYVTAWKQLLVTPNNRTEPNSDEISKWEVNKTAKANQENNGQETKVTVTRDGEIKHTVTGESGRTRDNAITHRNSRNAGSISTCLQTHQTHS